ncbi:sulfurtransferase complex subunit TusD [Thalassotalea euphylliae]|uniref:Sulfurtransferase complex subunit TusD n=1 Tax=Thalassotalea euphylliae TaxID=1655234 RepID=A0A3E0TSN3_9GAMM|nr:sulfurtransferase complex subunit TusD [Thalassotalea euphylliae]REL26982.1 sulfurtransferase complex subunit TusD [Thalassotalea euphylliae]
MSVYTLVVTTPPHQNNTATALEFAQATLAAGHTINGIFFYRDGVLNASKLTAMPSDELQAISAFVKLNEDHQVPLHLCITAGEKRGLTDDQQTMNIHSAFTVSGLGEMVELSTNADKVIQL